MGGMGAAGMGRFGRNARGVCNMNARAQPLTERAIADFFVFASVSDTHVRWLADTLVAAGALEPASLDPIALTQRIGVVNPSLVFIDFSAGPIHAPPRAPPAPRPPAPRP